MPDTCRAYLDLEPGARLLMAEERTGLQLEIGAGVLEVTPHGAVIIVDEARRVPLRVAPRF